MEQKKKSKIPSTSNDERSLVALTSKLVTSDSGNSKDNHSIKADNLPNIANDIKSKIANNDTIVDLFPDIELSIQILVSSILSPNDLTSNNLVYKLDDINIPSEVSGSLLDIVKKYISKEYKIEDKLATIVREALFTKGAYIETIIPESALDDIITQNTSESEITLENISTLLGMKKGFGVFKEVAKDNILPVEVSVESMYETNVETSVSTVEVSNEDDLFLEITDNPSVLKIRDIFLEAVTKNVTKGISNEDNEPVKDEYDVLTALFRAPINDGKNDTISIKTSDETERENISKPLILKLPVESTIPIYAKGDPEHHIGYFVMLDKNGVPVTDTKNWEKSDEELLQEQLRGSTETSLLTRAKTALKGMTNATPTIDKMEDIYSSLIEQTLRNKLKNSVYGDAVDMSDINDIYRVMFNRILRSQHTKMLYIPADLVSFFAFKYRDNGTGESLLETTSVIASIRAIVLFSRIMATVNNSITTTEVSATLDDNDLDPEKTRNKIISEVLKSREHKLPIGAMELGDLVDWSQKAGMKFNFKHASFPDMEVAINDSTSNKAIADDELDTQLQKHMIMGFGLTPEMVDNGFNSEFAATVVSNNILFAKRINNLQRQFEPKITKHIKTLVGNDAIIIRKIESTITANLPIITKKLKEQFKDNPSITAVLENDILVVSWIRKIFISGIEISLPKPELTDENNLKEAFVAYKESIEDFIELFISTDALPSELVGDISDKLDDIKEAVKSSMLRKWMSDNNYLPDLQKMVTKNESGNMEFDVMDDFSRHTTIISEMIMKHIKKSKKLKAARDKKLDKLDSEEEEETIPPEGEEETPPIEEETPPVEEETPPEEEEVPTGSEEDLGFASINIDVPNTDNITDAYEELFRRLN